MSHIQNTSQGLLAQESARLGGQAGGQRQTGWDRGRTSGLSSRAMMAGQSLDFVRLILLVV